MEFDHLPCTSPPRPPIAYLVDSCARSAPTHQIAMLDGECPVGDAEALLRLLQAQPEGPVDWSACTRLHTAVLQVLMAATPKMRGECGDAFVARWSPVDAASHAK